MTTEKSLSFESSGSAPEDMPPLALSLKSYPFFHSHYANALLPSFPTGIFFDYCTKPRDCLYAPQVTLIVVVIVVVVVVIVGFCVCVCAGAVT